MIYLLELSLPLQDPVAIFAVVLLVLLLAPLVSRQGIPSAVVLLLAGIALGPNAFGVLDRDPTMVLLGTIGLLYIMFLAGLEIDLHEFARHRRRSVILGGLTFALPQVVGTAVGYVGFGMDWAAAILLGSVFASHTLLAYPAAARLGLQRSNAVTTAVGATILTDTLALLVLAVVAGGARSGGAMDAADLVVLVVPLVAFGAFVLWAGPRIGAWFLRRAAQDATLEFVFVLAAVFICALGVGLLGVEPIIGAFLAGLALNRLVPEGGPLMNRIGFFGNALFVPFFLLSTGMLVDPGVFGGGPEAGRSWAVTGTMIAVILGTKGASAWATRPAFGYTADEARVVYGLTVPQAAATLAAVLVGVELGLFDGAVLNGTIAMVAVTCLIGPWLVETAGRRLAAAISSHPEPAATRSRLLVSLANPATVEPMVDLALLARDPHTSEPIVAVTVVGGGPDRDADVLQGERLLSAAVVHAAGAEVPVLPLVRTETNVASALVRTAAETRSSTLIMGWDGSAATERLLFGSIPDRVLRETATAVLIARGTQRLGSIRRFVVAVPPLAEMERGIEDAARLLSGLASRAGAELALLTPRASRERVNAAFARSRPRRPAPGVLELDDWGSLPGALHRSLRQTDALVLVSARRGAVAWQPSLGRLPRMLAERYPDVPLFVLYPGQAPVSVILPSWLSAGEREFLSRFEADHVRTGLTSGPLNELVRRALPEAVPEGARAAVLRVLFESSPDVGHEIRPGVVLVHAHTDAVAAPLLAIGISREGVTVPGSTGSVYIVCVLAVPAHVPSRTYLGWLALVARMLREDETLDAVRGAASPESAHAMLIQSLHLPEDVETCATAGDDALTA